MKKYFLAFDIGCIECEEQSSVIGIFSSPEKASNGILNYKKRNNWDGEHSCEIFEIDLEDIDKIKIKKALMKTRLEILL